MSRRKSEIGVAAEKAGLEYNTVYYRVHFMGMTIDEATQTRKYSRSAFPEEIKDFIHANYFGRGNQELADLVNDRFGTDYSAEKFKTYKNNHKLDSGLRGYFPKGHTPFNKGKKMVEYVSPETIKKIKKTCFKRGQTPFGKLPIGTEIARDDGYIWIKVADPNTWRPKHRVIYEKFHNLKIPKGDLITFLDGDPKNFSIDNLAHISKRTNQILNKCKLRFKDPDLTKTGIALARLKSTITDKREDL